MSSLLIKDATVLPFTLGNNGTDLDLFVAGSPAQSTTQVVDVLVVDDRISQVSRAQTSFVGYVADQVIEASGHLLMPGFVDGHTHTVVGVLEKCAYEALPLELWMLYLPPDQKLDPRMHYLCAAIASLEALKNGTTTLQDDLYALPYTSADIFAATAQAYCDIGMRASLSLHAINKPLHHTIPYLDALISEEMKQEFERAISDFSVGAWAQLFENLYATWHGANGLITTMLAPSATQRVTPDLMACIGDLSARYDVPIHVHLLETRTQAVTGSEFYGESVLQFAQRNGLLTHRTAIAHGIWLTPEDIDLVATAGATIVHNPVSNYRLCSGIASIRALKSAGVTLALGSDGMDSFNLFPVIRAAGHAQSVVDADYERYPLAQDLLQWATTGSARSAMLQQEIGQIAPGLKADLVLYDLNSLSFTPCHQIPIHLAYAEDGRSVRQVIVNGQWVVKDGQVTTLNEADILAEFRERLPAYLQQRARFHQQGAALRPVMDKVFRKAMAQPFPCENFSRAGLR